MAISVIIPVRNEAQNIAALLTPLQSWREAGDELILVDGGSEDESRQIAVPLVDRVLSAGPGRAVQMNAGAAIATQPLLLFLHADTWLPEQARTLILHAIHGDKDNWGRFDVRLSGRAPLLRLVERMMNLRSRLSGIATGDQAIFVERSLFDRAGGYQPVALMEDIRLSRALLRYVRPHCISTPLTTSSRRWEQNGVLRTILLMWRLRLLHYLGSDPAVLAQSYRCSDHDR